MPASYIDALLASNDTGGSISNRWNFPSAVGTSCTVTYSFLSAVPNYYTTDLASNPITNFQPFSEAMKTAARQALGLYSQICNITFTEAADSDAVQIRFGRSDQDSSSGFAYYPAYRYAVDGQGNVVPNSQAVTNIAGDVWIANGASQDAVAPGAWGFHTLDHEIGHAIGLKHPFDAAINLPAGENTNQYSVMAYNEMANNKALVIQGNSATFASIMPSTPMLYDIAAVQYLYGANMTTATGNDRYGWTANSAFYQTIWDAAGTDTIDASNYTLRCTINLNAGSYSSIGIRSTQAELFMDAPAGQGLYASTGLYDGQNNLAIAYGATIENALGGSANDSITGNTADNDLRGGAGNDTLDGGAGNDSLYGQDGDDSIDGGAGNDKLFGWIGNDSLNGGAGDDELYGDAGNDTLDGGAGTDFVGIAAVRAGYTLARANDGTVTVTNTTSGEVDTLRNVEGLGFSDGFVHLTQGAVGSWLYGSVFDDSIAGTSGNDGLFGDTGNDSLSGGTGDDYFHAVAGDGADTLDGGAGHDFAGYQAARTGYTVAMVDARTFTVTETASGQVDRLVDVEAIGFTDGYVGLIAQRFDNQDGSTWIQGTYRADSLTGTEGVDGLRGGEGNDTLSAAGGRDYLEGEGGSDQLDGGAGNDYAWYGAARANFTLAKQGDGSVTVTDTRTGDVDTLVGVEAVGFTDAPIVIVAAQRWDNGDGSGWYDGSIFADSITGTAQTDGMDGGLGDDTLLGGGGNDYLSGGAGNDVIAGEAGNDFLVGGAGADSFRFDTGSGFDRISDFDYAGGDRIVLATGTGWGAFSNPAGAWVSFGPNAAVLLAGVDPTQVNAGWFTFT